MADPQGISVTLAADILDAAPTWTRLDTTYNVQSWQIDRGRVGELDRTGTGTAQIALVDKTRAFDPTSSPLVDAGMQAAIALQNPVTSTWYTMFRGFVDRVEYVPYQTEAFANVTLYLTDAMALFAAMEMLPDGNWGDDVIAGNIVFTPSGLTTDVQERIGDGTDFPGVLSQAGWATGYRSIFTGNVKLQQTVYAPRSTVLQVIQDAADGEFPGVANFFIAKDGTPTFHGRLARFDPTNPDYEITTWTAGQDAQATASPTTVVRISPPLDVYRDLANLYTTAAALPQNVADADIPAQYQTDTVAAAKYGLRSWSSENLCTAGGTTTTALQETALFSQYIVDNYSAPATRVGAITIRPQRASGVFGAAAWLMICDIDISDRILLTTTNPAFNEYVFVEGVHYEAKPMNAQQHEVTLTIDVSPATYYSSNPF